MLAENVLHRKIRELKMGGRILDAGCGTGRWAGYFKQDRYTGIDINTEMLQVAKQHFPHSDFIRADIIDMPFEDGYFDCVISMFGVISHLPVAQQSKSIQEMRRVVKKGGLTLVTTGNLSSIFALSLLFSGGRTTVERKRFRIYNITPRQLYSMLEGFKIIEVGSYDFSFIPIQLVRLLAIAFNKDYRFCYATLMDIYHETTHLPGIGWLGKQLYALVEKV